MGLRFGIARAVGAVSSWTLKKVFHRAAANFPGKVGLYADPQLIADLRPRLREGAVVVVGTNGKTTVTNLLADALEAAGKAVACNRTGANLDSGVATALLRTQEADWGVLESDELWLAKILPQLRPRYVVLLNLFRDQLDRMGEIDHIQASIADALSASPATALVYNCDDPLCQAIAAKVENQLIPFGIGEDLGLSQNTVSDTGICQICDTPLEYRWRQYGQLGAYRCPNCGFERTEPVYSAHDVVLSEGGVSLSVRHGASETRVHSALAGSYMAYNLLAVCAAADCCNASPQAVDAAIQAFAPHNGRLQHYDIDGCSILLNLAKNPTGFNQNLRIVERETGNRAVAFFINDKEADGHDVSWLWDVDFQELAGTDDVLAFAGGTRSHDMQVRLKYAGIEAELVDGAADFVAKAQSTAPDAKLFLIANYTALPAVKAELDHLAAQKAGLMGHSNGPIAQDERQDSRDERKVFADERQDSQGERSNLQGDSPAHLDERQVDRGERPCSPGERSNTPDEWTKEPVLPETRSGEKLVIVHLYPELLNLYGDGGNVAILAERARRRGIEVEVVRIGHGERLDLSDADIAFLGGGPDREQRLASHDLLEQADELRAYVEDDGVLLAICGGYQILGHEWILGDDSVPGLGIVDIVTKRAEGGSHNRLVGNIVLESPLAHMAVVGYENHAGRTFLGPGCKSFGYVIGHHGKGNNDSDGVDGVRYRNVVGTYLHGPLLSKNPEVADQLIERALARRAAKENRAAAALAPLDDAEERAANEFMRHKLGVHAHE